MTKDEYYTIVKNNATHINEELNVTDDLHLVDDLAFDSLDYTQFILDVEAAAGIDFLNDDLLLGELSTVGHMWAIIRQRMGECADEL